MTADQDLTMTMIRAAHSAAIEYGGPEFGRWGMVFYNPGESAAGIESKIFPRQGPGQWNWMSAEAKNTTREAVLQWIKSTNATDRPWRALLMGGKDDGTFSVVPLYDDSPELLQYQDRWDTLETEDDLVERALPLLDL